MTSNWSVNGRSAGRVDPADRGLAYGDGLFETMAASDGVIRLLDRHLDRLSAGCARLLIPVPEIDLIRQWIGAQTPPQGQAVVKLIVTRGSGLRGYRPPANPRPTVIIGTMPWSAPPRSHYTDGIDIVTCEIRLGENPKLAGLKHLCRLEQVMAQLELVHRQADEGLLLTTGNRVVSGTSNNVFGVYGRTLRTPSVDRCGVSGVMRKLVIEASGGLGLSCEERDMDLVTFLRADELFVTNAVQGIRPVRRVDSTPFDIGASTRSIAQAVCEVWP